MVRRAGKMATVASAMAISVLAVYLLVSQALANPYTNTNDKSLEKPIRVLHAAWDNHPRLVDLIGNSTDIVVGQVTGIKAVYDKAEIPMTDYTFKIDSARKGNLQSGDVITIRQTGAEAAIQIDELDDDPLLKVGDSFLGFLRYSTEHDVYAIVGGPQGRLLLEASSLNSLDTIEPEAGWIPIKLHNKDLAQFEQEIMAEMNKQ